MSFHLIVAHQTAASPELLAELQTITRVDQSADFVLLVPATPTKHLLTWVEGADTEAARKRADEALIVLRAAGLKVRDAVVGPADPFQAIQQEVDRRREPYAEAIISTLPLGLSRWLGRDLPTRVSRELGLPVRHIVSSAPRRQSSKEALGPSLSDLPSDLPPLSLPQLAECRGRVLRCVDGVLGEVAEILYDFVESEPEWIGVTSRPLPFRTLLVPAVRVRRVGESLVTSLPSAKIRGQPHVDIGESFASLSDEEHIYAYFGLPFDRLQDLRVLRTGEAYPGQQRSRQNIFEGQ